MPFEGKCQRLRSKQEPADVLTLEELEAQRPEHNVKPLPPGTVYSMLKKMKRNAALAIDGWAPTLLIQAIEVDSTILDDCIALLTTFANRDVPEAVLRYLLTGRHLAVPKGEHDVRPITISNFWLKWLGAVALKLDNPKLSPWQFAAGTNGGAEIAYHQIRKDWEKGRYVIRLDARNAFGSLSRRFLRKMLLRLGQHEKLLAYNDLVYGQETTLMMFGPDGAFEVLASVNGVRAGDKTSSLGFQWALQCALEPVFAQWTAEGIEHDKFLFMDDASFTTDKLEHVGRMIKDVQEALAAAGLDFNLSKSTVLYPEGVVCYGGDISGVPVVAPDHYFRVLGGNVTNIYKYPNGDTFVSTKISADNAFFDMLIDLSADLHPQVVFAMLRLCGSGRLVFLCCTAPPAVSLPICTNFNNRVEQVVKRIAGFEHNRVFSDLSKRLIHDKSGLSMPNYVAAHRDLHHASQQLAEQHRKNPDARRSFVPLVSHERAHHTIDAQTGTWANDWMYYGGGVRLLSHHHFQICIGIRIRANPLNTPLAYCTCHAKIDSEQQHIQHVLSCSRGSRFGFDKRHDGVKHALYDTARRYGIRATLEPGFYNYHSGEKNRPDITFYTPTPTVVDVTVVVPHLLHDGNRARAAANEKTAKHSKAVSRLGHYFLPWAMETYGHFDTKCETVINRLARSIPEYMQKEFKRDMIHETSTALADGIATAMIAAHYDTNKPIPYN